LCTNILSPFFTSIFILKTDKGFLYTDNINYMKARVPQRGPCCFNTI